MLGPQVGGSANLECGAKLKEVLGQQGWGREVPRDISFLAACCFTVCASVSGHHVKSYTVHSCCLRLSWSHYHAFPSMVGENSLESMRQNKPPLSSSRWVFYNSHKKNN